MFANFLQDESIEGVACDGVWKGTRYFDYIGNRGVFVPLMDLQPSHEVKKPAGTYVVGHIM